MGGSKYNSQVLSKGRIHDFIDTTKKKKKSIKHVTQSQECELRRQTNFYVNFCSSAQ